MDKTLRTNKAPMTAGGKGTGGKDPCIKERQNGYNAVIKIRKKYAF